MDKDLIEQARKVYAYMGEAYDGEPRRVIEALVSEVLRLRAVGVPGKESTTAHDDYKPLDATGWTPLEQCPVCGSDAELWQYSESETQPRKLLVMCSHGDRIGPQDGLTNEGCPFYMPPDAHYRETIRDAVRYWNELARAIVALRESNTRGVASAPVADAETKAAYVAALGSDKGWLGIEGSYFTEGYREGKRAAGVPAATAPSTMGADQVWGARRLSDRKPAHGVLASHEPKENNRG